MTGWVSLLERLSWLLVAAKGLANRLYAGFVKRERIVLLSVVISMNARRWPMS